MIVFSIRYASKLYAVFLYSNAERRADLFLEALFSTSTISETKQHAGLVVVVVVVL